MQQATGTLHVHPLLSANAVYVESFLVGWHILWLILYQSAV